MIIGKQNYSENLEKLLTSFTKLKETLVSLSLKTKQLKTSLC